MATGVVRANNPNLSKEYGGDLVVTDKWARGVLEKPTWSKRKGTTGKVDPPPLSPPTGKVDPPPLPPPSPLSF